MLPAFNFIWSSHKTRLSLVEDKEQAPLFCSEGHSHRPTSHTIRGHEREPRDHTRSSTALFKIIQCTNISVTKRWVELFEMERTFLDICLEWKNRKMWHFPLNSYHCTIMPCASLASLWRVNRLTLRATDPGVAPWCNWHCATWCMHQLHQNTSIV